MSAARHSRRWLPRLVGSLVVAVLVLVMGAPQPSAHADDDAKISGDGSSWAEPAISSMAANISKYGTAVDYVGNGSTVGRSDFVNDQVDFAGSDIPFQFHPEDGSPPEKAVAGTYAYIPIVAGGTSFMYNLKINGQRVTNLRLSGENVSKIFTGVITMWNDPAIQADNPGLVMPARAVVPVVRSDGSGSTAQFTMWMISQYPDIWNAYCKFSGRAPACGPTSQYPTGVPGMITQPQDPGVAGYVAASYAEGAIGYVNYSYAILNSFPVAKVRNTAGYYVEPTPENVAVALLQAQINEDAGDPTVYLTQDLSGVYVDPDPRSYPLSSYSYLIVHTTNTHRFSPKKGDSMRAFAFYAMCEAQQQSASLGYSPIPINLVKKSFEQISKIPGTADAQVPDVTKCNNPTFAPDGTNLLADNAPQPQACDQQGQSQCPDGTGGMSGTPTAVSSPPPAAAGGDQTGGSGSGGTNASGGDGSAGGGQAGATGNAAQGGGADSGGQTGDGSTGGDAGTGGGNAASGGNASPAPGAAQGAGTPTSSVANGASTATTNPTPGAVGTPTTTVAGAAGNGSAGRPTGAVQTGGVVQNTACDPDTSSCDGGGGSSAQQNDIQSAAGPQRSTILDARTGWNTSLLLVILLIALAVALVLGPALAWRYYAKARTQ